MAEGSANGVLEFLENQADEEQGLGNAGIETYRDDPYASVAREIGQNSRDAEVSRPVRVRFDLVMVPSCEIPAIGGLQSAVECCLAEAAAAQESRADAETTGSKEVSFFEQAREILSRPEIPVLKISDSNTTGLTGPAGRGSVFDSLVKGSGVSRKNSDTSGGSFGIGKNAAYAVSDLQAVFYATQYEDSEGHLQFLAQGKVSLMSHTDEFGKQRQADAYWGKEGFLPFESVEEVPAWLQRIERGTTVCAVGFRWSSDWPQRIAYSVIQNFFHAIHQGEMEFSIDNERIVVNSRTLDSLFTDSDIRAAAASHDSLEDFELAEKMFRCLTSGEAVDRFIETEDLGRVQVRVLTAEEMPKKIWIIRNGMVITDNLRHFGDSFARFPGYRDFAALVVLLDDKGRAFIKRLENPRHDELSSDRLPSEALRTRASAVMKNLAWRIREIISKEAVVQYDDEEDADELRDFFDGDAGRDATAGQSDQNDPERLRYTVNSRRPRRSNDAAAAGEGSEGGGGGRNPGLPPKPKPDPSVRPRPGPGPGPNAQGKNMRPVNLEDIRCIPADGVNSRILFFTPDESGLLTLSVMATGISEPERMTVVSAEGADISEGEICCRVEAGVRKRVSVAFNENYTGPLEVSAVILPEAKS